MPQKKGLLDTIKDNVANWRKVEPPPSPAKKDYLAHNWTPPKGRKPAPAAKTSPAKSTKRSGK